MKKSILSIISICLLFLIMSCSGMIEDYSSVSVQFPEGTSNHLTLMRAADVPQNPIKLTLSTTGDYETSESKTFNNIDEINGSEIEIKNIPVDKRITVKLQISIDGLIYYEGTSEEITIKKGANNVNISLKPSSGKVDFEFDLSRGFEICATTYYESNESFSNNKTIPYSEYGYKFTPMQNGVRITTGNINWRINGQDTSIFENYEETVIKDGFLLLNTSVLQYLGIELGNTIDIYCLIIDGNNSASAQTTFEIEYPSLSITPDFNTPIALWNYEDHTLKNMILNSNSEIPEKNYIEKIKDANFSLAKDGIYHYGNEGKLYFNSEFVKDGFHNNLLYSDFETNNLYYLTMKDNEFTVYKDEETPTRIQIPLSQDLSCEYTHMAITNNFAVFSDKKPSNESSPEKIYVFKRQGDFYVECDDIVNFDRMNISQTEFKADYIKDLFIYEDKLYIIVTEFYSHSGNKTEGSLHQAGALIAVDLNIPENYKVIGLANNNQTFNVGEVTISVSGATFPNESTFYAPQRIIAIKQEELYIADTGIFIDDSSRIKSSGGETNVISVSSKSRIVKVNLKDFCISGTINLDNYKLVDSIPTTNTATVYVQYED